MPLDNTEKECLADIYEALEWMSESSDPRIVDLVILHVFENLRGPENVIDIVKSRLGPSTRRLYDGWEKALQ